MEELELVFFPLPEIGHLVSTLELAKRLYEKQQNFSITILLVDLPVPFIIPIATSYIQSLTTSHPEFNFVHLPPVDFPLRNDLGPVTLLSLFIDRHKSQVKEAVKERTSSSSSPSTRIAALIVDLFTTAMIDVGAELGIPTYIYFTSGAAWLALMLYLPTLHEKIPFEFKDFHGDVEVPGLPPLPTAVLPDLLMNKKDDDYAWYVSHGRRHREVAGLIVNTFAELEPNEVKAIANGECLLDHHPTPPIYPVGPLLTLEDQSQQTHASQLMEWLDQQHPSSVVFLCFGSLGAFSVPQLKEMALGLEQCGHSFLWSLRCRSSTDTNLEEILPDGFLDRTKGRGFVVQSWVPQVAILGHAAIGGFVSHCGWNSALESMWFGVSMLAWPLYAEQKFNAFQLVQDCGLAVGLRLDYEQDGWVSSEELVKGMRCLMGENEEGKKVRKRMKEMAKMSKKALEEGGSSFSTMGELIKKLIP